MPTYTYECLYCDASKTETKPVKDREKVPDCFVCGDPMTFVISGPVYANVKNPAAGG
jgi:putative FmdB family regulatory protein